MKKLSLAAASAAFCLAQAAIAAPVNNKIAAPTPGATPHWYRIASTVTGGAVSFTLTDGQLGDDDLTANGRIVDPGGPAAPLSIAIPTLSQWGTLIVVLMLGGMVVFGARRVRG